MPAMAKLSCCLATRADGASALTLNELRVSTLEKLDDYKVPEVLKAVSAIPRNALGKIDRKTLQSLLYRKRVLATAALFR